MELRHLRYFLAVARHSNFTQAAAENFVAQSALSQQIARLERELGVSLFRRTSRSVQLTDAGRALVPLASTIIADVDVASVAMDGYAGVRSGTLRLGLIQAPLTSLDLIDVLGNFHENYPGIRMEISDASSSAMIAAISAGSLDVAIVGLSVSELPDGVGGHQIDEDPLVVVVSAGHSLASRETVPLTEIAPLGQFVQFQVGSGIRARVDDAFGRAGVSASGSFAVGQVTDMIRLAGHGIGITVVPRASAIAAQRSGADIAILTIDDPEAVHPVTLAFDPSRLSAATSAFLQEISLHLRRPIAPRSSISDSDGSALI